MTGFEIAMLVQAGASLVNAFTKEKVDSPQSEQDKAYGALVKAWRQAGAFRESNIQTVAYLTGQTVDEVNARVPFWDQQKWLDDYNTKVKQKEADFIASDKSTEPTYSTSPGTGITTIKESSYRAPTNYPGEPQIKEGVPTGQKDPGFTEATKQRNIDESKKKKKKSGMDIFQSAVKDITG